MVKKRSIGLGAFLVAVVFAFAAILFASQRSNAVWDDSVLKNLAQSYRQQVFELRDETQVKTATESSTFALDGIVILVTGSTSGIGRSLVRWAFREGATIVAMGRSKTKLEILQTELTETTEKSISGRFFPIVADMSDLVSVSSSVETIRSILSSAMIPQIDIVVCNAGIFQSTDQSASFPSSKQGHELTFGVNYLSHFLLAEKLMRTRIAGEEMDEGSFILSPKTSRIVQVSSSFHMGVDGTALSMVQSKANTSSSAPLASQASSYYNSGQEGPFLDYLKFNYRPQRQYANSKLAQMLQTKILNRKYLSQLDKQGHDSQNRVYVPFVSACPGWVGTEIMRSKMEQESLRENLFYSLSFDSDGYGLASIIKAMFDPIFLDLSNSSETIYGDSLDHFPNVGGFAGWASLAGEEALTFVESILKNIIGNQSLDGIFGYKRDFLAQAGAAVTILIQPLFKTPDVVVGANRPDDMASHELFRYKSSVASYDRTIQEGLYEWSIQAVAEYL